MFRIDRRFVNVTEPILQQKPVKEEEEKATKPDLISEDILITEPEDIYEASEKAVPPPEPEKEQEAKPDKLDELLRITEEELERAKKTADEMIAKAQLEAERIEAEAQEILESARIEAETIKENAYNDAIAAGQEEIESKRQELISSFETREEELSLRQLEDSQMVGRLISEIGECRDQLLESLEPELLEFSLALAKKVVNVAVEKENGMYEAMVLKAIRQLKWEGKINLKVSPREFERFFSEGKATYSLGDEVLTVTAEEDEFLSPGDLIVETESETIDAGVDTQFKRIEIAFHDLNG